MDDVFYMIVTADIDGQWFANPKVFRTEALARGYAAAKSPPDGYGFVLYRCTPVGPIDGKAS